MKTRTGISLVAALILPLGCNTTPPAHNEDDVRRTAAAATKELKSDIKGTAEGIRDGLKSKTDPSQPADTSSDYVNINSAREGQLTDLPGITSRMAAEIVHGRPYKSVSELKERRILPDAVYSRNASHLTVGN